MPSNKPGTRAALTSVGALSTLIMGTTVYWNQQEALPAAACGLGAGIVLTRVGDMFGQPRIDGPLHAGVAGGPRCSA
jgi:hypothetical protein